MVTVMKLDLSKVNSVPPEFHLEKIRQFQEAQTKLEQVCKEKGIPVPIMVC